jgi:hypothetical protein
MKLFGGFFLVQRQFFAGLSTTTPMTTASPYPSPLWLPPVLPPARVSASGPDARVDSGRHLHFYWSEKGENKEIIDYLWKARGPHAPPSRKSRKSCARPPERDAELEELRKQVPILCGENQYLPTNAGSSDRITAERWSRKESAATNRTGGKIE